MLAMGHSNCGVAWNTKRCPVVVFYWILNVCGINSLLVYSENNKCKISWRDFLSGLGLELIRNRLQQGETKPFSPENYTHKNSCGVQASWRVDQRPTTKTGKDVICVLRERTVGQTIPVAISVSGSCAWNMQLSPVKTALGVAAGAKPVFVVEFCWYFHCSSCRNLYLMLPFRFSNLKVHSWCDNVDVYSQWTRHMKNFMLYFIDILCCCSPHAV